MKTLLASSDDLIRQGVLKLFQKLDDSTQQKFVALLASEHVEVKAASLEILIANHYPFSASQLQSLIADSRAEIKVLGLIATFQNTDAQDLDSRISEQFWQTKITESHR